MTSQWVRIGLSGPKRVKTPYLDNKRSQRSFYVNTFSDNKHIDDVHVGNFTNLHPIYDAAWKGRNAPKTGQNNIS